jgi:signal transduction histidine kinase
VKQVLFNLLDNAFKYARDAEDRALHVRCEACPRGVRLSVRDHGPGVAAPDLARIFQPFYHGQAELTRSHEGVGLGLALVQRLVQAMGGTIEASAANPGLRVSIVLPRA